MSSGQTLELAPRSEGAQPRLDEGGGEAAQARRLSAEQLARRANAGGRGLFRFGTICVFRNVLRTGPRGARRWFGFSEKINQGASVRIPVTEHMELIRGKVTSFYHL
jgi:hypothetical protein